jgi:DMSO/TMAO reductase YedYZ heme-binding membrane subunit
VSSAALWYLSRATGLVSFVLLSLVVVLGAVLSVRGRVPGLPRFAGVGLHRNVTLVSVALLGVHIASAVVDPFVTIRWVAVVVPLTSSYEPVLTGLGAFAVDLTIALVVTSLVRFRLGIRTWRAIHFLAYAAWPVAAIHGIGAAADMQSGVLLAVALLLIATVATTVAWRISAAGSTATRSAAPRRA